jgi:curved DNA-binding protein
VAQPAGDLMLEVRFRPHPRFRVQGRDLHLTLPVAPWEAALGTVVTVDLPQGSLRVRIPEGAQSGRQLRVRGKGIPGAQAGDLLLDIQVVLPPPIRPGRAHSTKPWRGNSLSIRASKEGTEPCVTRKS